MQEVKRPKKPLIYFYVAMILAILVFNCLVAPYLARKAIEDVDYGTFMTMTENGEIGKVQIQQNQIVFTGHPWQLCFSPGCCRLSFSFCSVSLCRRN